MNIYAIQIKSFYIRNKITVIYMGVDILLAGVTYEEYHLLGDNGV
jgi:hypothetical protein